MPCLETFTLKMASEGNGGIVTLKSRVRDHIIWKNEPVWRIRLKIVTEEFDSSSNKFFKALHKTLNEMIDFRVPIEVVDYFIAE